MATSTASRRALICAATIADFRIGDLKRSTHHRPKGGKLLGETSAQGDMLTRWLVTRGPAEVVVAGADEGGKRTGAAYWLSRFPPTVTVAMA
jgi:hypothetical protein